jgi:hypothetical protein
MSWPNPERRFAQAIALPEMTEWAMKTVMLGTTLLLTLSVTAQAAYAPVEMPRPTPPADESAMYVGPAGAMLEADYFRAPPQHQRSSDSNVCRVQLRLFDKMQLAQSCD